MLLRLLLLSVEVIAAQFSVICSVGKHMINDDEQAVGDGNQSFVFAHPPDQPTVLRCEVGVLRVRRCPCGLRERGSEVRTAFRCLSGATLTSGFVVAGTHTGPACQMGICWEAGHLDADLGDDDLGDTEADAGDGLQQPHRLRHERVGTLGDLLDNLLAEARGGRPPVKVQVVEHQVETKRCCRCGHWTSARFPYGIDAPVQYGPGVRARAVYLINYQLIPYKRASEVMKDLFGCRLSQATLANMVSVGAENLIEAELEIKNQLRRADLIHADETGVRVDKKQHWLHVASTEKFTHYGVDCKRGAEAIDRIGILPRFRGTCVHDGWWAYQQYTLAEHALCNAHIVRELDFFIDNEAKQKQWTHEMKELLLGIKEEADKVRAAGRKKIAAEKIRDFEQEYDEIISRGLKVNPHMEDPEKGILSYEEGDGTAPPQLTKRTPALNLVLRLRRDKRAVLHFMDDLKVPFTNNQAERDLRMAKLQQKISGCFRVPDGARFFCRLRSYISTMRKQGQEVVAALERVFSRPLVHPPLKE